MDLLAKRIKSRIASHKVCVVFANELEKCWPLPADQKRVARDEAIQAFAAKQGWSAKIHDPGVRVTFRKLGE